MSQGTAPSPQRICDAVLVAAGRGERLGGEVPKARVLLGGIPLFLYSLRVLCVHPFVGRIVVVFVPEDGEERIMRAFIEGDVPPDMAARVQTVPGGDRRQDSARSGLEALHAAGVPADHMVLIHDAARPLVSLGLITRGLEAMTRPVRRGRQAELPGLSSGSAWNGCPAGVVPSIPMRETLKLVYDARVVLTQPRENLSAAQTPQFFRFGPILRAHRKALEYNITVSDDAGLLEWQGIPLYVVPGESANLKVTFPEDLDLAERILRGSHYEPPEGLARVEL